MDWDTVDFTQSPAIQELPVTSAICNPVHGDTVTLTPEGKMVVRGEPRSSIVHTFIELDEAEESNSSTWRMLH